MGSWFKGEVWGAAPPEALPEQALSSEARRLSIECVCYLLARPGDDSKMQMPNLSRFAGGVTSVIRCCPEVEAASLYREAGCLVTLQQACGHTWNLQQHLQSECRQAGRLRTLRVPPALESCTKPESCVRLDDDAVRSCCMPLLLEHVLLHISDEYEPKSGSGHEVRRMRRNQEAMRGSRL